jgi:hypothetical protein
MPPVTALAGSFLVRLKPRLIVFESRPETVYTPGSSVNLNESNAVIVTPWNVAVNDDGAPPLTLMMIGTVVEAGVGPGGEDPPPHEYRRVAERSAPTPGATVSRHFMQAPR